MLVGKGNSKSHGLANASGTCGKLMVTGTLVAQPVNNKLFFAGEATSSEYAATVHGAFLSGEREAKNILSAVPLLKSAAKKTTKKLK